MKLLRAHLPSLRSPDYNWFLGGSAISFVGDWMDWIAINWLVLELTNSPFALGVYNFFRAVPTLLLTIPGGVAADRFRRRRIMTVNQIGAMVLTGFLTVLVFLHRESFWSIIIVTSLRGVFIALDRPARQALVPNLVPAHALTNAVAIFSAIRNASRIVGPSVGGILLGIGGVKLCLMVNSVSYLPVLFALLMIRERTVPASTGQSVRRDMSEAARYIRQHPAILSLATLSVVPMLFAQPYTTLVPVFARDLLHVGATGLGFLLSASATGAVLGALAVVFWGHRRGGGTVLLLSVFFFGLSLVSFSFSRWFPLSIVLLFAAGLMSQIYGTLNLTLLQGAIPDVLRGRIMSLYSLNRGFVPLGAFLLGSLASLMGPSLSLATTGSACMVLAVTLAVFSTGISDLQATDVSVTDDASLSP